jgi:hypothetical protein
VVEPVVHQPRWRGSDIEVICIGGAAEERRNVQLIARLGTGDRIDQNGSRGSTEKTSGLVPVRL